METRAKRVRIAQHHVTTELGQVNGDIDAEECLADPWAPTTDGDHVTRTPDAEFIRGGEVRVSLEGQRLKQIVPVRHRRGDYTQARP